MTNGKISFPVIKRKEGSQNLVGFPRGSHLKGGIFRFVFHLSLSTPLMSGATAGLGTTHLT